MRLVSYEKKEMKESVRNGVFERFRESLVCEKNSPEVELEK